MKEQKIDTIFKNIILLIFRVPPKVRVELVKTFSLPSSEPANSQSCKTI